VVDIDSIPSPIVGLVSTTMVEYKNLMTEEMDIDLRNKLEQNSTADKNPTKQLVLGAPQ
jgi:hypothetical protein